MTCGAWVHVATQAKNPGWVLEYYPSISVRAPSAFGIQNQAKPVASHTH